MRVGLPSFTVDTKLFRELGELLVGRESTALVELIKNAYDADATLVTIFGENITSQEDGSIVVEDNGVGMSEEDFNRGFLRIAGRAKLTTDRRSSWFKRRYTGEKGVGRLAAHKLARKLKVLSRKWNGTDRDSFNGFASNKEISATIDWDAIEALETFDHIEASGSVRLKSRPLISARAGSKFILAPLRRRWSEKDRERFLDEVATLTPPDILVAPLARNVLTAAPLFEGASVRDELKAGGFEVQYAGDFNLSDSELPAVPDSASWIIEIDCDKKERRLRIAVQPTRRTQHDFAIAEGFVLDRELGAEDPDVGFQARILQMSNTSWPRRYQGVRVYFEGFRVLPYGDAKDDWLELDRDYRSRGHQELGRLRRRASWDLPSGTQKEGLAVQGNTNLFGAVLLTRSGADSLEMLVNREGFIPGAQFDFIAETVRLAIDLQVRLRYAATSEVKQARQISRQGQQRAAERAASGESPSAFVLRDLHTSAQASIGNARLAVSTGRSMEAQAALARAEEKLIAASELGGEVTSEATMLRVVASLGLEHAAFVHEVRSLSLETQKLADTLERLAEEQTNAVWKQRLRGVAAETREIRERLRRNAIYLADVTGIEGRRRRSRQSLAERLERVLGFFQSAIARRALKVSVNVPPDLLTPPVFPAELTAILSNLLSNAVKFAGAGGKISITASQTDDALKLLMQNTGQPVELTTADRWFEPFRSTTADIDESLGQGMGLGLTITRSLIDEYGGKIEFVTPTKPFATAIQVELIRR